MPAMFWVGAAILAVLCLLIVAAARLSAGRQRIEEETRRLEEARLQELRRLGAPALRSSAPESQAASYDRRY
jgi:type II secretory pathway component PulK